MESPIQQLNKARDRQKNKEQLSTQPFLSFASSINSSEETYTFTSVGAQRTINFHHPFSSSFSWIRAIPEIGSSPLITYRSDRRQPAVIDHLNIDPSKKLSDFKAKKGLYRTLRQGEFEFSSKGLAQSYYSDRQIREDRAGIVRSWENQDELESGHRSPLHRRVFVHSKSATIDDEIREGVVKRAKDATNTFFPKVNDAFAKEIYTKLKSFGDDPDPTYLLFKREGQVIDETGIQEKSDETGKALRVRNQYFTEENQFVQFDIDETGNVILKLPEKAEEGIIGKVPNGSLTLTLLKDLLLTTSDTENSFAMNNKGVQFETDEFKIGKESLEFIVMATKLKEKLNSLVGEINALKTDYLSHMHISPMGPTSPPTPPFTGLFSQFSESGIASSKHQVGEP